MIKIKTLLKYLTILSICFICGSCKEQEKYQLVEVWNGQNFNLTHLEYPVSIIWFKESATDLWIPHKGFCQANEIKEIIQQSQNSEDNGPVSASRTHNKMSLFYYNGGPAVSRVLTFYFDVNDGTFVGPRGKSKMLGKILVEKEESGLVRYIFTRPPYKEHEIDNIEMINQQLHELQEKYERQKDIQDANK